MLGVWYQWVSYEKQDDGELREDAETPKWTRMLTRGEPLVEPP